MPEWFELFRTSSERNIFKIGSTEVAMESWQAVGSSRIRHKFSMTFGGQVDVALNVRCLCDSSRLRRRALISPLLARWQYALLRNLGSLATAYQQQMEQVAATGKLASPYAAGAAPPSAPVVAEARESFTETLLSAMQSEPDLTKRTIQESDIPTSEDKVVVMKPVSQVAPPTPRRTLRAKG